jgi:hypothetical protein
MSFSRVSQKGNGTMRILTRVREAFNRWLEKLAASNKDQFGSGRPDCCQMNRTPPRPKAGKRQ